MTDSILNSTKKAVGIAEDYLAFDVDIIMHINTIFSTLAQLGVGPATGYMILDANNTWDEFLGSDLLLNQVKSYMYLRVRLLFDPPATSFAIIAMEKQVQEFEWRINVVVDTAPISDPTRDETDVWLLSQTEPMPADIEAGDVAYDPITGDLWRITT